MPAVLIKRIAILIAPALALGLMLGCEANPQAPARIKGTVTYKGDPLPAGTVMFHTTDMGSYPAVLSPDGTYTIRDVPKGKVVVTIETESANPKTKKADYGGKGGKDYAERLAAEKGAAERMPPPKYVKIPRKYADREQSPLNFEARAGDQVHNFTLTDD
jgi:hypothetical protein